MLNLKDLREILAAKAYRFKFRKLGCFIRGRHMGREKLNYCLACGSVSPEVSRRAEFVTRQVKPRPAGRNSTPYLHNERVRQEARENGL